MGDSSSKSGSMLIVIVGAVVALLLVWLAASQFGLLGGRPPRTMSGLLNQFRESKIEFGDPVDLPESRCEQAKTIIVAGAPINIYLFDLDDDAQAITFTDIANTGLMEVGMGEEPVPATVSAPFVLTGVQSNPRAEQIDEALKSFNAE